MSFLVQRRTIGFKLEGTPYAKETLVASDFDIAAWNINYSPEIAMMVRKIAKGTFAKELSVAGKQTITVSFSVDVQGGGAINNPPTYFKCLRACGMKQTIHTTTGVSLSLDSDYSNVPATIEIVEKDEGYSPRQVVIAGRGCMGNARLVVNAVGEPGKIEFEFKGVLDVIEGRLPGAVLTPTGFDSEVPDAVMCVSVTAFGDSQTLNKITIDLGNDVQIYSDPKSCQGVSGAHVVDRNPKVDFDPDLVNIAVQDWWTRWTEETQGELQVFFGSTTYITSSSIQTNKAYAPGEREGHVVQNLSFIIAGDDLEIIKGSKA